MNQDEVNRHLRRIMAQDEREQTAVQAIHEISEAAMFVRPDGTWFFRVLPRAWTRDERLTTITLPPEIGPFESRYTCPRCESRQTYRRVQMTPGWKGPAIYEPI